MVTRQQALQPGQVRMPGSSQIVVPGLGHHGQQQRRLGFHLVQPGAPGPAVTGRVQRLPHLHAQQALQTVLEQGDLTIGMDHRLRGVEEPVQIGSGTQPQHRKCQRRQRQTQHRVQPDQMQLAQLARLLRERLAHPGSDLHELLVGNRRASVQQQTQQQWNHLLPA